MKYFALWRKLFGIVILTRRNHMVDGVLEMTYGGAVYIVQTFICASAHTFEWAILIVKIVVR